jgi:AcrR family transcriptional regulator
MRRAGSNDAYCQEGKECNEMPTPHAHAATLGTATDSEAKVSTSPTSVSTSPTDAASLTPRRIRNAKSAVKAVPKKGTATMRRVPRQERSKVLVECIRIAARDILEKKGPKALTTNNIAARAGVSIGSLYQYFANKEEILEEVFREQADQSLKDSHQWAGWVKDLPVRDVIRLVVEGTVRRHRDFHSFHPDFYQNHHRELHIGLRNSKDDVTDDGEPHAVAWLRDVFSGHANELRVTDPNLAAVTMAHGMAASLSGLVDQDATRLYDESLGGKLAEMFIGMLLKESS